MGGSAAMALHQDGRGIYWALSRRPDSLSPLALDSESGPMEWGGPASCREHFPLRGAQGGGGRQRAGSEHGGVEAGHEIGG